MTLPAKKKTDTAVDLSTFRLSLKGRFDYALGDFGYNFMYYWLSAYLTIYYTDTIGISAGAVSVMMLVIRFFDAVNDPVIGSLADRTKTRWGRYRPWYMLGSIAMAVFIVLIFSAPVNASLTVRMVWMWGIYILLTVASTCSNMPYGALNGCITPNTDDRNKVSNLRMLFANTSSMVTIIIAVPLISVFSKSGNSNDAHGYMMAVLITCILGLPTMVYSCWNVKEIVTPPPTQDKIPLKAQIKSLVQNKAVLILIFGQLVLGCVIYGRAAMLSYYWQYNAGNAGYATIYGWISLVAAIVGTGWLGDFLYKKFMHKGRACATLNFITAGAYIVMFFTPAPSFMFWVTTFIGSMSFYAYMGVHFGAIGDATDYGEYIAHVRCDGFLASFVSLANKAGGAIMPAIGVAVLGFLNYEPNVQQSTEVLTAINFFISLIPALLSLINGLFYLIYPISAERHREIMAELIHRRQA